jgi:hypothetical protein
MSIEQITPRVLRVLGQNPGKVSDPCSQIGNFGEFRA